MCEDLYVKMSSMSRGGDPVSYACLGTGGESANDPLGFAGARYAALHRFYRRWSRNFIKSAKGPILHTEEADSISVAFWDSVVHFMVDVTLILFLSEVYCVHIDV